MSEIILTGNQEARLEAAQKMFSTLRRSEKTKRDYQKSIKRFIEFIGDGQITENTLVEYYDELASHTEWSVSTKNKYMTSARVFMRMLHNLRPNEVPDITKDLSGKSIGGFKQNKRHKKDGVSPEDMQTITNYLKYIPNTPKNLREKAIYALLIFQGLRSIEIVRLDVDDLDLRAKTARVLGKGEDDKVLVALHSNTVEVLSNYLEATGRKSGPLFVNEASNSKGERLSTKSIRKIVKQLYIRFGIKYSPHQFRHAHTTTLINAGLPLPVVQHYTRHSCLETLQHYYDEVNEHKTFPKVEGAFNGIEI